MRTRSKLALIGIGATLIMAFAMSTASARNLSISNQNIRTTFNNLELTAEGVGTTTCHVTLEGSLHSRTINKTPETLLGNITRAIFGNCNSGVTVLTQTLPWNVRYVGFTGRLPDITLLQIRVLNVGFRMEQFGIGCLARADTPANIVRNTATRELGEVTVPLTSVALTGFLCPATANFRSGGPGTIMLLGNNNKLTLTLI